MPIGADGLSGTVSSSGAGLRGGSLHSGEDERPLPFGFVRLKNGGIGVNVHVARQIGRRAIAADPELAKKAKAYEADVLKFAGSGGIQMQGSAPWSRGGSDVNVAEKSPEGWSGTVKAMKKNPDIDNPFALAWSMKKKGYKPHVKPEESIDDLLAAADELLSEGSIPTADLATKPPKGVDPEVWHDVVHRGKHTDYGGARAHYNRSIAKMKNATPGPQPSAAELSGGRYGTERYRDLNQRPFVAPGWHRNVGEGMANLNDPKVRREIDAAIDRGEDVGPGSPRRGDFAFSHEQGGPLMPRSRMIAGTKVLYGNRVHRYVRPLGGEKHLLHANDGYSVQAHTRDIQHYHEESEWSDKNPDLYARIGHEPKSPEDNPYRPLTLKQKGFVKCHQCGGTGPTHNNSCNACGAKIKENSTFLTGSPTDKTRLTGTVQIRIKEGTSIDVRSPDRILDNVNVYLFFEQWQQLLPKSPLLQANTMFRISEWWKLHAEQGDILSIDLTTGATQVVNESTGKQYSLGCFGTQPDIFMDDMEAIERL